MLQLWTWDDWGSATRRTVAALLLLSLALPVVAQDLEPRRYFNTPINQNFLLAAIGYSSGDVAITPGLPLTDADLSLVTGGLAYIRTLDVGGKTAAFDAFLPLACADGSALLEGTRIRREICGQGDIRLRFIYNFFGAPALELKDFVRSERKFVMGMSFQVEAPIGQYDAEKLINIGANRWVLRPEIGLSVPLGRWSVGFAAGARFFQDNDEFLDQFTLSQDPLYNMQAHVVFDLSRKQWLSLNGNFFFGGETFRDGVPSQVRQENSRLGITWHIAPNRNNTIQLTANSGVVTRVGNDSTTVTVSWLYRWE